MKLISYVFIFILILASTGCASITRENLAITNSKDQIIIKEKLSTVSYRGLNVRCEEGALPGIYTAEREDANGTYFFGEGRSIWNTNEILNKIPRLSIGGIYLPKNKASAPRFFYIFEMEETTIENVDSYIQNRISTSFIPNSTVHTGGGGVVGNAIAGGIVMAIIQSSVGQVTLYPEIENIDLKKKIYDGLVSHSGSIDK